MSDWVYLKLLSSTGRGWALISRNVVVIYNTFAIIYLDNAHIGCLMANFVIKNQIRFLWMQFLFFCIAKTIIMSNKLLKSPDSNNTFGLFLVNLQYYAKLFLAKVLI